MVSQQYKRYSDEADRISQGVQTAQTRARLQFLLSSMSTMREFSMDKENDTCTASNGDEQRTARAEKAFESLLRTGAESEYRTYSPMSDAVQGAFLVPQQWAGAYSERLKAFNGIREAGAQIVGTSRGGAWLYPSVDDTSAANDGTRLNESDAMPLVNPTFSSNTLNAFRYVSNGVQVSNELLADSGIPVSAMLQNLFAKRVGRITNKEFTLGAGGGPAGVIPSITNIQTAAATGLIGLSELVGLQSIDEGFLPTSVYMFSSVTERLLKNTVGSDGRRLYPEMNEGTLLGYPYVRNNSMPSPAASAFSVVFGSFKLGVTIRELPLILLVSSERFGEFFQTYFSLTHRQDCIVNDASALAVLQQHA
jgi:HK97 family phage major capsid protein